jgi:hypothetical protein
MNTFISFQPADTEEIGSLTRFRGRLGVLEPINMDTVRNHLRRKIEVFG